MPRVTGADLLRMRDQLFYEGLERHHRLTKYWSLLLLAAVIASAGVISDSTATVIGAMIVAPLMTPILGIVLAIVLTDGTNLRRSILLVLAGATSVVAVAWTMGHFLQYGVTAATNSQVSQRVSPTLIDLVAALATGAVGAVALAREDISDTLPGVAIAISLVPPLAVVGLTLEAGVPDQAAGALILFLTNVSAILGTGILVMRIYGVQRMDDDVGTPAFRRSSATVIVVALIVLVAVPLVANSVARRPDHGPQPARRGGGRGVGRPGRLVGGGGHLPRQDGADPGRRPPTGAEPGPAAAPALGGRLRRPAREDRSRGGGLHRPAALIRSSSPKPAGTAGTAPTCTAPCSCTRCRRGTTQSRSPSR